MRAIKLSLLILILISTNKLLAQNETDNSFLGVSYNRLFNSYNADFRVVPGYFSSNTGFFSGNGSGHGFGGFITLSASNKFDFTLKSNYLDHSGTFIVNEPQVISVDGTPINANFKHTLNANISTLGLELLGGWKLISNFRLLFGGRIGIMQNKVVEQYETLESNNIEAVYTETGNNVRNYYYTELPNVNSLIMSGIGGLQFDINMGKFKIIPEVFYDASITNFDKTISWKASNFRAGISLAYTISSPSHIIIEELIDTLKTNEVLANNSNNITDNNLNDSILIETNNLVPSVNIPTNNNLLSDDKNNIPVTGGINIIDSNSITNNVNNTSNSNNEEKSNNSFLRNSISIVPVSNKSQYNQSLIKGLKSIQSSARYDYNTLNENAIINFQKNFKEFEFTKNQTNLPKLKSSSDSLNFKDSINLELIIQNLKETLLQNIIKVGTSVDSVAKRFERSQKRSITSAKAEQKMKGLTPAQEIEIINNTFVGIEVLNDLVNDKNDVKAKGMYYWFNLTIDLGSFNSKGEIDPNSVNVRLIKKSEASASSNDMSSGVLISKQVKDSIDKIPKNERALGAFTSNILNMATTMEQFRLKAVVQSVVNGFSLDIGNREGIYLDQGYRIFEPFLTADNKVSERYIGFVRIENIADNNTSLDSMSKAYSIIDGSIEAGHIAKSYDQFLDLYFRPNIRFVNIPKAVANWVNDKLMEDDASSSINLDFGVMMNIAKYTQIKQLFTGINISIGLPNVPIGTPTTENTSLSAPTTIEASIFVMKKFWFNRLNISTELDFGVNTFSLSGTYIGSPLEINTGMSYGVGVIVGVEYAINPDMNFGAELGYRIVLPVSEIVVTSSGRETTYPKSFSKENEEFFQKNGFNDLNLGGLRFGLRFSYSLQPIF